jgi:methyl-accepting chemotaxis protein
MQLGYLRDFGDGDPLCVPQIIKDLQNEEKQLQQEISNHQKRYQALAKSHRTVIQQFRQNRQTRENEQLFLDYVEIEEFWLKYWEESHHHHKFDGIIAKYQDLANRIEQAERRMDAQAQREIQAAQNIRKQMHNISQTIQGLWRRIHQINHKLKSCNLRRG